MNDVNFNGSKTDYFSGDWKHFVYFELSATAVEALKWKTWLSLPFKNTPLPHMCFKNTPLPHMGNAGSFWFHF